MHVRADQRFPIQIELNGRQREGLAEPRMQLCDFLRHELGTTGVHVGCEHGVCGACTVLVDGVASRSCLMLAVQAHERRIDTVESLSRDNIMNDLQQAFSRHHALQCGFCTAGILMSCVEFLERVPSPDETQVRDMLSGHLCRCTGYTGMVRAVLEVAQQRQEILVENNNDV
tara:strand:+ start:3850 stop:4365 length:516 start_codon:yes stop_codon:yes gene_type:complete